MIFTVVMVSYNRDKKLKESVKQLLGTSLDEIVVVDNNSSVSTRETLDELARLDSRLSIIKLNKNKGASFGFYTGLEYLENKHDRFITTFLDDDAFFDEAFLDELRAIHKRIGVDVSYFCPKVINKNNIRLNMNRPMSFVPRSLTRCIKFFITRRRFGDSSGFIEAASFIGLTIFNDGEFRNSSLIPTDYFLYYDDLVFTYRLSKRMQLSGYCKNDLVVTHDVEDSGREFDEFRLYYILRNCRKFNGEIKGVFGVYPLLVNFYYFFIFAKKMKLNVFCNALFKRNSV